jgi:hypothetical protein
MVYGCNYNSMVKHVLNVMASSLVKIDVLVAFDMNLLVVTRYEYNM